MNFLHPARLSQTGLQRTFNCVSCPFKLTWKRECIKVRGILFSMLKTNHHESGAKENANASYATYYESRRHAFSRRSSGNTSDSSPHAKEASPTNEETASPTPTGKTVFSGRQAATLCVLIALAALGLEMTASFVSQLHERPTPTQPPIFASVAATAAILLGIYAQTTQSRHWSRRVQRRLLAGVSAAVLTLVLATFDLIGKKPATGDVSGAQVTPKAYSASVPPSNANSLSHMSQPGWYGEKQKDGILFVLNSFDRKSETAERFNRRLTRSVSYATLTLINLGHSAPWTLSAYRATLHFNNGQTASSLDVVPLLRRNDAQNTTLTERLARPPSVALGGMLADLPLCAEHDMDWSAVTSVTLTLGKSEVDIPGRLLTQEEKAALLSGGKEKKQPTRANGSAESWFKNL